MTYHVNATTLLCLTPSGAGRNIPVQVQVTQDVVTPVADDTFAYATPVRRAASPHTHTHKQRALQIIDALDPPSGPTVGGFVVAISGR